ncbi:hypothetical protein MMC17_004378 [Xylographa soralifera]|nr:hypothetical protein [Xylographa soralifera]
MKFAIQNSETQKLLESSNQMSWSVISFFFHDRGTEVQKTVESLLIEVLYQLLDLYPKIIPLVLHLYLNRLVDKLPRTHGLKRCTFAKNGIWDSKTVAKAQQILVAVERPGARGDGMWPFEDVKMALDIIVSQKDFQINVCLFVDALDENNGDSRVLLSLLDGLVNQDSAENQLVEEIIDKANGVFIWVKLVVHELIEGIGDGSSIPQLHKLLGTIPAELDDLYSRIITKRKPAYMLEASIMFQAVLYTLVPLSLEALITTTDVALHHPSDQVSLKVMQQRIISRCGGLLDIYEIRHGNGSSDYNDDNIDSKYDDPRAGKPLGEVESDAHINLDVEGLGPSHTSGELSNGTGVTKSPVQIEYRVQLLHQTFKDFLLSHSESNSIFPPSIPMSESIGYQYLLQFCVYTLTEADAKDMLGSNGYGNFIFEYARRIQFVDKSFESACSEVDKLAKLSRFASTDLGIAPYTKDGLWVHQNRFKITNPKENWSVERAEPLPDHREYDLLLVAAENGLIFYVKNKLLECSSVELPGRCPLIISVLEGLRFVIINPRTLTMNEGLERDYMSLLEILLAKGGDLNCMWKSRDPIITLLGNRIVSGLFGKCLEWLLHNGATVKETINVTHIIRYGHSSAPSYKAVELLLLHGANAMKLDDNGWCPLYHAIYRGFANVAELLCQHGADPARLGNGLSGLKPDKALLERLSIFPINDEDSKRSFGQQAASMHDMLKRYEKHAESSETLSSVVIERSTEPSSSELETASEQT